MILLFVSLISGIVLKQYQEDPNRELLSRYEEKSYEEFNVKVAEIESLWYVGRKSVSNTKPFFFSSKINVNRATEEELLSLPGIGPVLAKRIVEFRKTNGPFSLLENFKQVKGIGEKKFIKLIPYIKLKN